MIKTYINSIQQELATENALEHSYRPALKTLIESINTEIRAVNEPVRSQHGAPDFVFLSGKNTTLIRGYAETKDVYVDLNHVEKTEQLKRYLGYPNLILTNYLEFRFFKNGEKYQTITIAKKEGNILVPLEENFELLEQELKAFLDTKPENITSAKRLAEIMGGKAARIRANVLAYLQVENEKNEELLRIYNAMKKLLVHDLEIDKFADMYAQTLVYGLFVARYYDNSPNTFTRQEARDLIPASNSFLQHFFDHIAGPNFDRRLTYIVDELCEVFTVSDVRMIIQRHYNLFGETVDKDPIIHFYEDFLKEYDPKLRKSMGAYYTPVPVVNFIIRAVDDVLKKEFDLPDGLASTEKAEHKTVVQGKKGKVQLHRVQILDPAVGTATFLNETVKFIYKKFENQKGLWPSYVEKELLPRMYGFELMMAPYTIAHLKLAMTLRETGVDELKRRLGIYLTNTLEEGMKIGDDLFSFGLAEAISEEAKSADVIKTEKPIMVVIGNPPYSVSSNNKNDYIEKLIAVYKEDLNERKINLDDDYIKFIRFSESLIEKNHEGIVAIITNNSFIDGTTHRQMRKHLLETFNSIYILNLHGSTKKKEISPDGSKDENVFNIQQGVSINIFVKKNSIKRGLASVYYSDLFGSRKKKFEILKTSSLSTVSNTVNYLSPSYFFVPKDFGLHREYEKFIDVSELFLKSTSGIETQIDRVAIQFSTSEALSIKEKFMTLSEDQLQTIYKVDNKRDWSIKKAIADLQTIDEPTNILYRPFDNRQTFYSGRTKGIMAYPRGEIMSNLYQRDNIALLTCKRQTSSDFRHVFVTNTIAERCVVSLQTGEVGYVFPLYLYSNSSQSALINSELKREPNFNMDLVRQLLSTIGEYKWIYENTDKADEDQTKISPLDIFDYIYATLHSVNYRNRYKEFLRINFPRIPQPKNRDFFWHFVKLGRQLRRLHLLEIANADNPVTYPVKGNNIIEKVEFNNQKIYINPDQYFDNVQKEVWNFYIGGYQPAQKWLKDRKGRKLEYDDIVYYQKIIKALFETERLMKEMEKLSI